MAPIATAGRGCSRRSAGLEVARRDRPVTWAAHPTGRLEPHRPALEMRPAADGREPATDPLEVVESWSELPSNVLPRALKAKRHRDLRSCVHIYRKFSHHVKMHP